MTPEFVGSPLFRDTLAERLGKRLAQGDPHILYSMVIINMGIAIGHYFEVDHAVTGNLIQHVVKEWYA